MCSMPCGVISLQHSSGVRLLMSTESFESLRAGPLTWSSLPADPSPVRERWGLAEPKLPPNKTGIISVAPGQASQARLMEQWNNGIIWSATPAAAAVAAPSGPGAAQPAASYQIEPYPRTAKGSLRVRTACDLPGRSVRSSRSVATGRGGLSTCGEVVS